MTATYVTTDKTEMTDYWSASENELREDFSDYVLTASSTDLNLSDRPTYYYAYEGTYAGVRYGFRQYFILAGNTPADGMFVLTYTASKDENPQTRTVDYEETSGYMDSIAGNFRLTGALPQGKTDLAITDAEAPEGIDAIGTIAVSVGRYQDMRVGAGVLWTGWSLPIVQSGNYRTAKTLVWGFPLEAAKDFDTIYKYSIQLLMSETATTAQAK